MVKNGIILLRKVYLHYLEITLNHVGDFFCLNCFHSYRITEKLKKHGKVCNNHDYYYVEMPDEDNKILKYNHRENSLKALFMIYADLECLLEENAFMSK